MDHTHAYFQKAQGLLQRGRAAEAYTLIKPILDEQPYNVVAAGSRYAYCHRYDPVRDARCRRSVNPLTLINLLCEIWIKPPNGWGTPERKTGAP